ncbi:MAG: hypothetical protein IPN53_03965 [Comamonadaceae bacterium]|nr:hypothetical protein [Comamonadaceae bacterium]
MPATMAESIFFGLRWLLMLSALNALGWLVIRSATSTWHDAGWSMAKPLSLLGLAFVVWIAARFAPVFHAKFLWIVVVAAAVATAIIARQRGMLWVDRTTLRRLAAAELRFIVPFIFYASMRGFNHDIIGLEKFMDFAFMNAAMATASLPVPDPWFSGESINYYYFGHFLAALLSKLSGTPATYGYNLMLCTLFGATFQLAYTFVFEMARHLKAGVRSAMALVAGAWLTIGGNVHGFVYGFVKPLMIEFGLAKVPDHVFLISDPTRFVGHNPATNDKLIHEFPAYAFYVGDLHAHLINLHVVLLLACILLAWFRSCADQTSALFRRQGWMLVAAWLIGLFAMTNSWDGLMYGAMLGTILSGHLFSALRHGRRATVAAIGDGMRAVVVIGATALPFVLYFQSHSARFLPTHSHTPVWQWLILYGLQAALALAGCAIAFRGRRRLLAEPERCLLAVLTLFGITFALVPEFVYMKDIYGSDYYRSNTAFKFGFQAFSLLTLCACVGIAILLSIRTEKMQRIFVLSVLELVLVPPLYYGWFVVQGGFSVWRDREWTLDGQRYLLHSHPEDYAVINWLAAHGSNRRQPLVEGMGDSYSFGARISANTGIPTIMGWPVHEQLWRGSDPEVWRRRDDVNRLYNAKTVQDARSVLKRYRPRWLIVGQYERQRYPELNAELLAALGHTVFRAGETLIVDLYPQAEPTCVNRACAP